MTDGYAFGLQYAQAAQAQNIPSCYGQNRSPMERLLSRRKGLELTIESASKDLQDVNEAIALVEKQPEIAALFGALSRAGVL